MKTLAEIQQVLREQQPRLAEQYGVYVVGVFGSYVRGRQGPDSDIDILVELERPPRISLIDLIELEYELGELLGAKVDIVLKTNLRRRIGERILGEVVSI